jgi:hypothetical protein
MVDQSRPDTRRTRRVCSGESCRFVQRVNPTPVVGALVEHEGEIILARNALWPDGWFALITGFLDAFEDPRAAVASRIGMDVRMGYFLLCARRFMPPAASQTPWLAKRM